MLFGIAHLMKVHTANTKMKTEEQTNHYVLMMTEQLHVCVRYRAEHPG